MLPKIAIKPQGKTAIEKDRNREELLKHPEKQKYQNGNKYMCINSYFKRQWTTCSNQMPQGGQLDKKQDSCIRCKRETHFRPKDTHKLKVRGWKKIFHANGKEKKAGVAIHISDKIDFKAKTVTRDKEGYHVMIKGTVQQEDTTFVNFYAPNMAAPKHIKQLLTDIKAEIDSNTTIVRDSNTPHTPIDRSSKQKIHKETSALNDTLDQSRNESGEIIVDISETETITREYYGKAIHQQIG